MIFLDSNVPMYVVGGAHPNKDAAVRAIDRAVSRRTRLVTDAEVLQEVLHRYVAIGRRDAIQPTLDLVLGLVDEVLAVDVHLVLRAKDVVSSGHGLSARDAVHVAAMERLGCGRILSFDRDFDRWPGIERLS